MKKFILILILILQCLLLHAADSNDLWPRPLVKGCWVRYKLIFPENTGIKNSITCQINVHSIKNNQMDLDFFFQGIDSGKNVSSLIQVNTNNFNVAEAFGLANKMPALTAVEKDTTFSIATMKAEIKAKLISWPNQSIKTEVIRSDEVPFGLIRLIYGQFVIQIDSYSWGETNK